ncbi:MAG: adenylyl-sulfate kinase [Chloroflexi bacterium]|nr:MAG: adenylyl-sulfate kinase [Chloroflexota bacterium]
MMNTGFTIWFTGLSGSGKSTLSEVIEQHMKALGRNVEVLDGDIVRTHLSKGLGFSREDRDTNIKRIGFVCNLLTRNGVICISAAIAPYRDARDWGVDDPYEEPLHPELIVETDKETVEESVARIFAKLTQLGYLEAEDDHEDESKVVVDRLAALGYL